VIVFGQQPLAVTTSPEKGYNTLGDLIAAGRAKPGALNYSSAGVGSASHFGGLRLLVSAGLQAQHIPTKGANESLTEIIAGRVDFSYRPSPPRSRSFATASSSHSRSVLTSGCRKCRTCRRLSRPG
jgi:tripartite-type tricarboxylate transporter receptor subunit TctC